MVAGGAPSPSSGPRHPGGHRILVCHPRRSAGRILSAALEPLGIAAVGGVVTAEDLEEAVSDGRTDLLVLDAGVLAADPELVARVRRIAGNPELPVVAVGRFTGAGQRRLVLAAGATDLLAQPVTRAELAARVRVLLENRSLHRSLQEVIRSLQTYHTGATQRMQLAREMQLALLPPGELRGELERRYDVRLDCHFESSSELGGDIWGARPLDDGRFAVFLCDFTGHGFAAALNTFRLHALLAKIDLPGDDPAETLGAINRLLVGLLPESQFATMIYAVVDTGANQVVYATAGAPKPLIGYPDRSIAVGSSVGLPLGVSPGAAYRNRTMDLPPGAFLFLFSDALHEGCDWEGRRVGYDGVLNLVRQSEPDGEGSRLDGLLERYFETVPRPLADDLTAVWISRRPVSR